MSISDIPQAYFTNQEIANTMKLFNCNDFHFSLEGKELENQILVIVDHNGKDYDINFRRALHHVARSLFGNMKIGRKELAAIHLMFVNPKVVDLESGIFQLALSKLYIYCSKPRKFLDGLDFIGTSFESVDERFDTTVPALLKLTI